MGGRPPLRFVPAGIFRDQVADRYEDWKRDLDDQHVVDHAVICDPAKRTLGIFARKPQPSQWLSEPMEEDLPLQFSHSSSELMGRRARATWSVFCSAREELAELELPALVKLACGRAESIEHLWFRVHESQPQSVDATLLSDPWNDIGFDAGDRRVHDLERLSDWSIISPLGMLTPRSTRILRAIRADREHVAELVRQVRSEQPD